ncbi:hypothetical protein AQJ46_42365 [Streptomyces canus]|uniref:Uncharacterized protein n=1 Tax=Streptomyces canus TaxID=58343 RepID=A0A117QX76_9ACTN|nr:hypothetical protein [Streptomyces canus]KUN58920.1 hypothetical protein AQJ46_42365 [Streptomyces canus]
MLHLDFNESVRVDPDDLRLVLQTILDDPDKPPPDVQASFDAATQGGPLTAEELWRLTNFADPAAVYGLTVSEAALSDVRLAAHLRLSGAVREQAPRTTAALELLVRTETELAISAARSRGET